MAVQRVLEGLDVVACAMFVVLALAWIVFHPLVAVCLQASVFLTALGWRLAAHAAAS